MCANRIRRRALFLTLLSLAYLRTTNVVVESRKLGAVKPVGSKNAPIKQSSVDLGDRDDDNLGFIKGMVKVNIFGNLQEFAFYYTYIGIGNPPVKQMVIIDTGSQLVNVACGRCSECGYHMLENYEIARSVTHRLVDCKSEACAVIEGKCSVDRSCTFKEKYSEGSSVEGMYVGDLISFDVVNDSNNLTTFFDYIGCVTKESNLIKTQITNGILGLSKSEKPALVNDEYYETQSFIEKYLTDHFRPNKKIFSLCLSDNGGVLTLGGHDKDLDVTTKENMTIWVPMLKSEFYVMRVYNIGVKGSNIDFGKKKFVLDTGTTLSTFDSAIFEQIYKSFSDVCEEIVKLGLKNKTSGQCKVDTKTKKICFSDITKLPPIILFFENGKKFEWSSDSYMIDRSDKKNPNRTNWWCMGIDESKTKENILGATFFKNNHIVFNLVKNKIGLSSGKCPENRR